MLLIVCLVVMVVGVIDLMRVVRVFLMILIVCGILEFVGVRVEMGFFYQFFVNFYLLSNSSLRQCIVNNEWDWSLV